MSALRRRLAAEDHGVTVVELLVAILLLGIVGTITVTGLVQGMQTTRYSQDRVEALAATQTGLERMSRELRAADPLRSVAEDRVTLDIRRSGSLYHYDYEVRDAGGGRWELAQSLRRFDSGFDDPGFDPTTDAPDHTSDTVLVPELDSDTTFTFLDGDGNETLALAEVRQVEARVERVVQPGYDPIVVTTTVKVRNNP